MKFDFDIVPPIGTSPGIYNFTVDMVCDGIVKASQNVTLEVPGSCVPNPQVSLAGPTCPGNTRTLDATASKITGCSGTVEYQWKDSLGNLLTPPGPFSSANSVLTQSPAASTSYTLEIRCSDTTGCPTLGTKTIPVNVDPLPPANAGPDLSLCLTFAGTLGTPAVAGLTYDWSPPTELSNPFIAQPIFSTTGTSPLGIRNYTLTVTDPGTGCKSTSTVKVTVISGSPVGSVANALRAVKKSLDVNLSWPLGALVPRTYNVHREDAKAKLVIPLPTLPIGQASNVEVYTDPGAIPAGTRLFFYRVYGRDCAGNSVYN